MLVAAIWGGWPFLKCGWRTEIPRTFFLICGDEWNIVRQMVRFFLFGIVFAGGEDIVLEIKRGKKMIACVARVQECAFEGILLVFVWIFYCLKKTKLLSWRKKTSLIQLFKRLSEFFHRLILFNRFCIFKQNNKKQMLLIILSPRQNFIFFIQLFIPISPNWLGSLCFHSIFFLFQRPNPKKKEIHSSFYFDSGQSQEITSSSSLYES